MVISFTKGYLLYLQNNAFQNDQFSNSKIIKRFINRFDKILVVSWNRRLFHELIPIFVWIEDVDDKST
jgi:hypothetical protein